MKKIFIKLFVLTVLFSVFLSCEVALGSKLDIEGPVVEILTPVARKAVSTEFSLEGSVSDKSPITLLLITSSRQGDPHGKQWRYTKGGVWHVSEDFGVTWVPFSGGKWIGSDNNALWKIDVDLTIDGLPPLNGEFLFTVQAWDSGGFTDDNSLRTRVLIYDIDPPMVDISSPFIHRGEGAIDVMPLSELHGIDENIDDAQNDGRRFDPSYIGQFLTQGFKLQWQIEDDHDVWSIDVRFYEHDEVIDTFDLLSPLPEDFIYQFQHNLPQVPSNPQPDLNAKPNGSIMVPALDSAHGMYDEGYLANPINKKTTVKVVTLCVDAAGNIQKKILGYFIYWPRADEPWITYPDGMEPPEYFESQVGGGSTIADIVKDKSFMIYPGRTIRSTAFHATGVKNVIYSLYHYNEENGMISSAPFSQTFTNIENPNTQRPNGSYSNIFSWEFRPPSRSGYYVLKATAISVNDKESEEYSALFRVQDITFPDFESPIHPVASDPLFMHIENDSIVITGFVRDATNIVNLDLVWINPASAGFAAMSQLSYFREPDYAGWKLANGFAKTDTTTPSSPPLTPNGDAGEEGYYDSENPNRIYRLLLEDAGVDPDTQRQRFMFSRTIPLAELNIGADCRNKPTCPAEGCEQGKGCRQPLISQMFLFRAENPDHRTTIITYAPQGDTLPPVINIENVKINDEIYKPRAFAVIDKFINGDVIQINGTWREDSSEFLDIANYFNPNFIVEINGVKVAAAAVNISETTIEPMDGILINWRAQVTVGNGINQIPESALRDTLVINASTRDIGGNRAESGCSWLIKSDYLRLLRISSDAQDGIYNQNTDIILFLEFSKPVQLAGSGTPALRLNSRMSGNAAAIFDPALNLTPSTRQYFKYTVASNDSTLSWTNPFLDVTALETALNHADTNYPFVWQRGSGSEREEIRVTNTAGFDGTAISSSQENGSLHVRTLPVSTINTNGSTDGDHMYTLIAGKNIRIDTQAPTVSSIAPNTVAGDYTTDAEIFITVKFSKPVQIGTGANLPRLRLQVTNTGNGGGGDSSVDAATVRTSGNAADIRVNGTDVTFVYKVRQGDTTNGNAIVVTSYEGSIRDLAGTSLAANGISNFALTGRTLTGRFIDTIKPGIPTVRILQTSATGTDAIAISNTVNGAAVTGISAAAAKNLSNVYNDNLYIAIQGNTANPSGAHKLSRIDYSITGSTANYTNFGRIDNWPNELQPGNYTIIARQVDRAGNTSDWTAPVSFNWSPGTLVSRIDSTSANGTYTNSGAGNRQDTVNITVHFRENVTVTGTPTITLNSTTNAGAITYNSAASPANSISFTYTVQTTDNTPTGVNLDVTGMNVTATTGTGENSVSVGSYINNFTSIAAGDSRRLRNRKSIRIETGALRRANLTTGAADDNATYSAVVTADTANDAWTGYFDLRFTRPVTKGSGNIIITQIYNTTASDNLRKYRLPAVLTEAQSSKYKNAVNFDNFYKRGVNGLSGTTPDTGTKFVLNYAESTIVNPNNTGTQIEQMAYAFHQAEIVTIPLTSQDVEIINDHTLRIKLTGSNALCVLGAEYQIRLPASAVIDTLSYRWPSSVTEYTYITSGINKPFIRIDKKVNADRITRAAGNTNGTPQMSGLFTNVLETTARFDCRTPGSNVRYNAGWYEHTAASGDVNAHGHGTAGPNWRNSGAADAMITFANTGTNSATLLVRPAIDETTDAAATAPNNGIGGTTGVQTYSNFASTIDVGNTNESGYTLRVAARSRLAFNVNTTARAQTTNVFTANNHNIGSDASIHSVTVGGTAFFLRVVNANSFKLFNTMADAAANGNGQASSGAQITVTIIPQRNSDFSEEVAFRSVLTYELWGVQGVNEGGGNIGHAPTTGSTLWIRGGDAPSTSSIAGFPLTWDDDYAALSASGGRAGVRAMRRVQGDSSRGGTTAASAQVWRWITWEVNVNTYNEVIMGETFNATTTATPSVANANEAWQFGPREWRYPRGGWVASKHLYTIYPGRHRWVRLTGGQSYSPGGQVNWTAQTNIRPTGLTVTAPSNPANQ